MMIQKKGALFAFHEIRLLSIHLIVLAIRFYDRIFL